MKKWALGVAIAASLIGVLLSALSTSQHLRLKRDGFEQSSFCAVNEVINCDVANASSYSQWGDIPVAWWGLIFYLLVGGMALYALVSARSRRGTVTMAWLMSVLSLFWSVRMGYILLNVLGVVCLECLGMYLVNVVLFVVFYTALGVPWGGMLRYLRDYVRAAVGRPSNLGFCPRVASHLLIIVIAFGLGWVTMTRIQAAEVQGDARVTLDEKVRAHYLGSIYPISVDPRWPVWGNPEGEIVIVEFSDFECPFCRTAAFNIRPYLQEFRKDVQVRFVHYPLDKSCNPTMEHELHQQACLAARAAVCAEERKGFWDFHDELFRHQKELGREKILTFAEKRGWSPEEFSACLDAPETAARVTADIEVANHLYIHGTPTIIINGRKVSRYWRDGTFLQAVVREEIKRAKTIPTKK